MSMTMLVEASNAAVGVADGRIVPPRGSFDVVLRFPDAELRPGLINAHDHLHRNHYGRLGTPPYRNVHEWGDDIHRRYADAIADARARPRAAALLRGAERNLRAGVTTVVHHDSWETHFDADFPITVVPVSNAHSPRALEEGHRASHALLTIHLAEGIDAGSAEEIRELDRHGLLNESLLAVHVLGCDADGIRRLRSSGAAVVWCPTSNLFLYGRTAPADLLAPGVDVLLGSDSLLSSDGSLLDELRAARALALISDARLEEAVGDVAARRLRIPRPSLRPGSIADLAVIRKPLLQASDADVALVVSRGVLRLLDPSLIEALGAWAESGEVSEMNGVARWLALREARDRTVTRRGGAYATS